MLLDNNNREPVARLRFNGRRKYLGLLDENREGTRHPIESLDEIYEVPRSDSVAELPGPSGVN